MMMLARRKVARSVGIAAAAATATTAKAAVGRAQHLPFRSSLSTTTTTTTSPGYSYRRSYCRTVSRLDEEEGEGGGEGGGGEAISPKKEEDDEGAAAAAAAAAVVAAAASEERSLRRHAAQEFNDRRAAYNRQVSVLRKKYGVEVAQQRASDKAEREARARVLKRQRLERQRLKNVRSAERAIRQETIRSDRAREFEEHLEVEQQKREAKEARFAKARQLVVDELEAEAPLWLTTRAEVDAAFSPEAEQLLWSRPGGILGAPNPSLDCHFWQYETHTWKMNKTYPSQREVLLEELEDQAYEASNVDRTFWTDERLEERRQLEEKARLRAMVHSVGRSELLRRQKLMLEEELQQGSSLGGDGEEGGGIPKPLPAPNLRMLKDDKALEREGARVLMDDPTKFFVFDRSGPSSGEEGGGADDSIHKDGYSGPALGSPTGLRDPLRENSHQNSVFPQIIGRIPKPDTRTEREKKQQEREDRLLAAATAEAQATTSDVDIEMAAQQQTYDDLQPDLNYDDLEVDDADEDEWRKGLDPVADADTLSTPRERRYSEADIDWVVDRLEEQVKHLEQQFGQDVEGLKQTVASEARLSSGRDDPVEEGSLDAAIMALSEKEILALSDLQDRYAEEGLSIEEVLAAAAEQVPGLDEQQTRTVLERLAADPADED